MKPVSLWAGSLAVALTCAAHAQDQKLPDVDFRKIVRTAKAKVFPAVVYIRCLRESHEMGKRVSHTVTGSGVIISATGEVLTNWHVVDKALEVRCQLADGTGVDAKVVGKDKSTDLALLQLELPEGKSIPPAAFGDSAKLVEGDFVMAMGAPWGMNRSVSIGIISCTSRYLPDASEYCHWLQTDAQISPGNSGGPLVNTDGEIIGINTRGGGDMGFAIPSSTIQLVLPLLRQGEISWSWTGLQLQPLRDFNRNVYFEGDVGVIVAETDPGSPARQAGLRPRDRLLSVNGVPTTALTEEELPRVRRRLGLLPKQKPAVLEVKRGEATLTLELIPRAKGQVEGDEVDCPRWDFTVKEINQFDNPDLYFYRKKGVFVFGIKSPGNAQRTGLSPQDVILKINGTNVETLDDVKAIHAKALKGVAKKHKIVLTTMRGGLTRVVVLDFARDYARD